MLHILTYIHIHTYHEYLPHVTSSNFRLWGEHEAQHEGGISVHQVGTQVEGELKEGGIAAFPFLFLLWFGFSCCALRPG